MKITPQVRKMKAEEYREIISIDSRAFWNDILSNFFIPDLLKQHKILPTVMDIYISELRRKCGDIWVATYQDKPYSVAAWRKPGYYPRRIIEQLYRDIRLGLFLLKGKNWLKGIKLALEVERLHPKEKHYYLTILATEPKMQGRGFGTSVIQPVLERCDKEGIPAYLETNTSSNVTWYKRIGFKILREISFPYTPTVWCLWRDPL